MIDQIDLEITSDQSAVRAEDPRNPTNCAPTSRGSTRALTGHPKSCLSCSGLSCPSATALACRESPTPSQYAEPQATHRQRAARRRRRGSAPHLMLVSEEGEPVEQAELVLEVQLLADRLGELTKPLADRWAATGLRHPPRSDTSPAGSRRRGGAGSRAGAGGTSRAPRGRPGPPAWRRLLGRGCR